MATTSAQDGVPAVGLRRTPTFNGQTHVHYGCFKDLGPTAASSVAEKGDCGDPNGYLYGPWTSVDFLVTPFRCSRWCAARGYSVVGTRAGKFCYCGSDVVGTLQVPKEKCSMRCVGNVRTVCGGEEVFSVYRSFLPVTANPKCLRNETKALSSTVTPTPPVPPTTSACLHVNPTPLPTTSTSVESLSQFDAKNGDSHVTNVVLPAAVGSGAAFFLLLCGLLLFLKRKIRNPQAQEIGVALSDKSFGEGEQRSSPTAKCWKSPLRVARGSHDGDANHLSNSQEKFSVQQQGEEHHASAWSRESSSAPSRLGHFLSGPRFHFPPPPSTPPPSAPASTASRSPVNFLWDSPSTVRPVVAPAGASEATGNVTPIGLPPIELSAACDCAGECWRKKCDSMARYETEHPTTPVTQVVRRTLGGLPSNLLDLVDEVLFGRFRVTEVSRVSGDDDFYCMASVLSDFPDSKLPQGYVRLYFLKGTCEFHRRCTLLKMAADKGARLVELHSTYSVVFGHESYYVIVLPGYLSDVKLQLQHAPPTGVCAKKLLVERLAHCVRLMHRAGVAHGSLDLESFVRDSTDNHLLCGDWRIQFNLRTARVLDDRIPLETPSFLLAPGAASVDGDVWDLGLVIYQIYTGTAFMPTSSNSVSSDRRLNGLRMEDPGAYEVISRLLSRNPSDRLSLDRMIERAGRRLSKFLTGEEAAAEAWQEKRDFGSQDLEADKGWWDELWHEDRRDSDEDGKRETFGVMRYSMLSYNESGRISVSGTEDCYALAESSSRRYDHQEEIDLERPQRGPEAFAREFTAAWPYPSPSSTENAALATALIRTASARGLDPREVMAVLGASLYRVAETDPDLRVGALARERLQDFRERLMESRDQCLPRYYVVLPGNGCRFFSKAVRRPSAWDSSTFRLFLLCEGLGPAHVRHEVHFTQHSGYAINSPEPFVRWIAPALVLAMRSVTAAIVAAGGDARAVDLPAAFEGGLNGVRAERWFEWTAKVLGDVAAREEDVLAEAMLEIEAFFYRYLHDDYGGLQPVQMADGEIRWLCHAHVEMCQEAGRAVGGTESRDQG